MKYYIAVLVMFGVLVAAKEIAGVIAERDDEKDKCEGNRKESSK